MADNIVIRINSIRAHARQYRQCFRSSDVAPFAAAMWKAARDLELQASRLESRLGHEAPPSDFVE